MLAIKKTVNLDFLGAEYKDAYLIFKSIPLKDYENIIDAPKGDKEALKFIQKTLEKYFISGKAPDENGQMQDVKKEELGDLDGESAVKCFEILSGTIAGDTAGGREIDPLEPKPSEKPSKTAEDSPPNS